MEFIFRSKLNKDVDLEDINLDIKDLTISNSYKYQYINYKNFDLCFFLREGYNIQDYLFEDNDYLVIVNGEIKNINKIKKSIATSLQFQPQIVLDYFKKNGEKIFSNLTGEFSILIYIKKTKKIISSIDKFGIKNLFFYSDENTSILSTRLSFMLSLENLHLSLNENRVHDFLSLRIRCHEYTFYNEILKIRPSHYLTNKGNYFLEQINYFNFDNVKKNDHMSLFQASQNIKTALTNSVNSKINNNKKIGVLFSGGLDSSSITSILASQNKYDIYGISATYKKIPIKNINLIDETTFQNNIYNRFNKIKKYQFDASSFSILDDIDKYIKIIGEPFFFPNLYVTDKSYYYAFKQKISLVYNGNDGDTIISHGHEVLFYYFMTFKWIKLYRELKLTSINRGVGIKFIFKRLIYDLYLKPFLIQSLKKIPILKTLFIKFTDDRKIFISPRKNHKNIIESTLHQDSIYKHSCVALYYGIEEAYPFYDIDLISCCLQIPSSFKFRDGMPRFILRHAMEDYVPKENLTRMTKSNLAFALCMNLIDKKDIIESEFINTNAQLRKFIDLQHLSAEWNLFKKDPFDHVVQSNIPSKILTFLVLNKWLNRHFNIDLATNNNLTNRQNRS